MASEDRNQQACAPCMAFSIRSAEPRDVPGLAVLWSEMQCHYGKPVTTEAARQAAGTACHARQTEGFEPRTLLAVAADGTIVGSLVLVVSFPANELTRALYIRDLYVSAVIRRQGVARALLRAAAALALAQGFSALDWTTDAGNTKARQFYTGEGARRLERIYYRLDVLDMQRMLGEQADAGAALGRPEPMPGTSTGTEPHRINGSGSSVVLPA